MNQRGGIMLTEHNAVFEQALALPAGQRQALVEALLDSLPAETAAEIDAAWQDEIDRRLAAFMANPASATPAEQVFAQYKRPST
jgi:putative addiction module component (TIGR02574 family)